MKNILQIMDYAAPYRGNFIPSIECLEQHWTGNRNVVYLFPAVAKNIPWVIDMKASGKKVYFIDSSFFSKKIKWSNIQKLKSITKQENISVIHTHFVESNYTLFLFSKLFDTKIRIVANLHNHYQPSGRLALLKTWVMKQTVDFFIGDSESVSESAYAVGIKKMDVKTVLNSIQFKRLDNFTTIDLSKGENKPVVLMFGYPWHRKGVDVVAKAIQQINEQTEKDVILAIAMAGGQEETRIGIESALGYFPTWVEFLPPREDLATYYNAAHLFISAGREEGLSYSPIEAAYCNCMLICSKIPGNPLDIPLMPIYEVEDVAELKVQIEKNILLSELEKAKIKIQQREFVLQQYNVDFWAEEIIKSY